MTPPPPASAGCGGDGCSSPDPWPLHHVRHRSLFSRLCTSCVLRHHAGAFCSACFALFEPNAPAASLAPCANCPAAAHLACLPSQSQSPSPYLCPSCSSPDPYSYFPAPSAPARAIDFPSARVLLAAAQIAAASMSRACASTRADADRKAKEAAVGRKRGRDFLERALAVAKRERERVAATATAVDVEATNKPAAAPKKPPQDRNFEKWMRFNEPMQAVLTLPLPMMPHSADADKNTKSLTIVVPDNAGSDGRDQAVRVHRLPNAATQDGSVDAKEGERRVTAEVEANKGPRIHEATQDGSGSRRSNGSIFMGVPNTASLHS